MILYFDSFITDIPLLPKTQKQLKNNIRNTCDAYKMPKKIDIAKYTLASYAVYLWSHVLIRYELDDVKKYKEFDKYIKSLFPKAKIMHRRSDSQKEYIKSVKMLEKFEDDWIFYAPNNDHPIVSPDPHVATYLDMLIRTAQKWMKKYPYASIMYSHYTTFINLPVKGNPENFLEGRDTMLLDDNKKSRVYLSLKGDFTSVQIVPRNLFKTWFTSADMLDKRIIRAEDVRKSVTVRDHVIIVPKKEICAHFDSYEHMLGQPNEIQTDQIPPLLIPKGFFENTIKISYGYAKYREGWLNINPCAKRYRFRDELYGTDLKITLDEIPFFWQNHIAEIDINHNLNFVKINSYNKRNQETLNNPWNIRNQGFTIKTLLFWMRYTKYRLNIQMRTFSSFLVKSVLNVT